MLDHQALRPDEATRAADPLGAPAHPRLVLLGRGILLVIRDRLGQIIIASALILPDVAGFGIAGMRLDLRQAQDELAALKLRVETRQD